MRCDELVATTVDGVRLAIDRVPATGARRGVVVCLHGMMTDGRYFGARRAGSFAQTVAATGYDVLVANFRGHGRSRPPAAGQDDWSFDDLVELDLPAIVATAARASACAPADLTILGHSLGGLVTTAALGTHRVPPVHRFLVAATAVWFLGPRGPLHRRAIMATYRHVTTALGRAPIRALRLGNADEPVTFVRQLTGWTQAMRWTSLRGLDYLAAARAITTPTIPFAGAGDWMCKPADAVGFAGHITGASPVRVIGRAQGFAIDPDHFQLFTRRELQPWWRRLAEPTGDVAGV